MILLYKKRSKIDHFLRDIASMLNVQELQKVIVNKVDAVKFFDVPFRLILQLLSSDG